MTDTTPTLDDYRTAGVRTDDDAARWQWLGITPALAGAIATRCTPRQAEVLQLAAQGGTPTTIARHLGINQPAATKLIARAGIAMAVAMECNKPNHEGDKNGK